MWQKAVEPFVRSGKLVAIGVVQEQHPDRTRLYAQWRGLDWPIFVDSLNVLDLRAVPIPVLIDEGGIVRAVRARAGELGEVFVEASFARVEVPDGYNVAPVREPGALRRAARAGGGAGWRALGDALFVATQERGAADSTRRTLLLNEAVQAYERAVAADAKDGRAHFRLGVALRARADGADHRADDAQRAVAQWGAALSIDPNQYIWRRRIQQYGPRLDKPYDFYSWVDQARRDLRARGVDPVALGAEPLGSEVAAPVRTASASASAGDVTMPDRDPQGRIQRDARRLIRVETLVTPAWVQPGRRVRVRVTLAPDATRRPFWNNESDDLEIHLGLPSGVRVWEGRFRFPNPVPAETRERRVLECELSVGPDVPAGEVKIPAYVLYYVCENAGGVCYFLRQDFEVRFAVDPEAPPIQ